MSHTFLIWKSESSQKPAREKLDQLVFIYRFPGNHCIRTRLKWLYLLHPPPPGKKEEGGKKRGKKKTPTPKWLQVTSYNFGQVCTTTCLRTHPKIISSLTFTKTQLNSEPPWEIWVHKFRTGDQDANKSVDTSQEPLSLSLQFPHWVLAGFVCLRKGAPPNVSRSTLHDRQLDVTSFPKPRK